MPLPEPGLVGQLEPLLEAYPLVMGLYLFGSHTRGRSRPDSDVDLGVLVHHEVDATRAFRLRLALAADCEQILARPVDLVVLGQDLDLTFRILQTGHRLFERDRDYVRREEARLAGLYYDYQPFLERYLAATRAHFQTRGR